MLSTNNLRIVRMLCLLFFFNDTATTEIYTLSLHDALPIYVDGQDADDGESDPARARPGQPLTEEEHGQGARHRRCRARHDPRGGGARQPEPGEEKRREEEDPRERLEAQQGEVAAAEPRPAPLHQEEQRDQYRAREGQAQAPHQEDGDARHDELADATRAPDDRHRGGELEAGAEVTRARSGYVLRLTWSASLQKAQTVPVVTWPQRTHSRSSTASARSNAARALSRKPNKKL